MASWQTYIDTNLVGTGKVSQAAIVGNKEPTSVWASSNGFNLSAEEQSAVVKAFENLDNVRASGVKLGGTKYFTLTAEPKAINGKKGADGCVLVKTTQTVLIAVYKAPIQQTECNTIVTALADYLEKVGF